MSQLACPYDKITLQIASMGLGRKLEEFEKTGQDIEVVMEEAAGKPPATTAERTAAVAAHYGISVEMLINSPNYAKLDDDFTQSKLLKIIEVLKEKLRLNDKEAWAFIAYGIDEATMTSL